MGTTIPYINAYNILLMVNYDKHSFDIFILLTKCTLTKMGCTYLHISNKG